MIKLDFPDFEFKLKKIDSKTFIFDFIRNNYYLLTPEEWVRQHVIKFLFSKGIPKSHIALEKSFTINNLKKRFDVVVKNSCGKTIMLIEFKSPFLKITQKIFD